MGEESSRPGHGGLWTQDGERETIYIELLLSPIGKGRIQVDEEPLVLQNKPVRKGYSVLYGGEDVPALVEEGTVDEEGVDGCIGYIGSLDNDRVIRPSIDI